MRKEASSRLKINRLLEESGWILVDTKDTKSNVDVEPKVRKSETNDIGFIDYLLLDKKGFPLGVIEAKSEDKDPLVGKEQARTYAMNIKARFIILSNGNIHYLWDIESGNPRVINVFPTQETLIGYEVYKPKKELLINEIVESDFIVQTQLPNYKID
jgi:type I restriction enzyme R subunit